MSRVVYVSPSVHCGSLGVAHLGRDASGRLYAHSHDYATLSPSSVILRGGSQLSVDYSKSDCGSITLTPISNHQEPAISIIKPPRDAEEDAALKLLRQNFAWEQGSRSGRLAKSKAPASRGGATLFGHDDDQIDPEDQQLDECSAAEDAPVTLESCVGTEQLVASEAAASPSATMCSVDYIRQAVLRVLLQLFASSSSSPQGALAITLQRHDDAATQFRVSTRLEMSSAQQRHSMSFELLFPGDDGEIRPCSSTTTFSTEAACLILQKHSREVIRQLRNGNGGVPCDKDSNYSAWATQRCASLIALCGHAMAIDRLGAVLRSNDTTHATKFELDDILMRQLSKSPAPCWRTMIVVACRRVVVLIAGSATSMVAWTSDAGIAVEREEALDRARRLTPEKWKTGSVDELAADVLK